MTHYLLDTNHASATLDATSALNAKLSSSVESTFSIPLPVVGELWYMVLNSRPVSENTPRLNRILSLFVIVPFDATAARAFGEIRTTLRRAGRPIPQIDVQIAAIARTNAFVLLTADAHFGFIPELSLENWIK